MKELSTIFVDVREDDLDERARQRDIAIGALREVGHSGNTKRYVVRAGTGLRPLPSLDLSGGYVVRTPDGNVGVPLTASIRPEQWADPSAAQAAVDREMRRVIDSARGLVTIEGVGDELAEWLETQKECAPLSTAHTNESPPSPPEDSGLALADQHRETQRRP